MKKEMTDWLTRFAKGDKRRRLLVGIGMAGIVLIAVTEWIPHPSHATAESEKTVSVSVSEAEEALEKRLCDMVSQIEGAGECQVMVTLENGVRYLYATDTAVTSDSSQETTVTVQTEQGPMGLLITQLQPTVNGVSVICKGGGLDSVKQQITELISTTLHISSRQVCVVAKK